MFRTERGKAQNVLTIFFTLAWKKSVVKVWGKQNLRGFFPFASWKWGMFYFWGKLYKKTKLFANDQLHRTHNWFKINKWTAATLVKCVHVCVWFTSASVVSLLYECWVLLREAHFSTHLKNTHHKTKEKKNSLACHFCFHSGGGGGGGGYNVFQSSSVQTMAIRSELYTKNSQSLLAIFFFFNFLIRRELYQ